MPNEAKRLVEAAWYLAEREMITVEELAQHVASAIQDPQLRQEAFEHMQLTFG